MYKENCQAKSLRFRMRFYAALSIFSPIEYTYVMLNVDILDIQNFCDIILAFDIIDMVFCTFCWLLAFYT